MSDANQNPSVGNHPAEKHLDTISRRNMLKTLGVTIAGALTGTLAIPAHLTLAANSTDATDAWAIAATSVVFAKAMERAQIFNFKFVLDAARFEVVGERLDLVGVRLRAAEGRKQGLGVDLIATINTQEKQVSAVQCLVGRLTNDFLDVQSTLLTKKSLDPVVVNTRSGETLMFLDAANNYWNFPHYSPSQVSASLEGTLQEISSVASIEATPQADKETGLVYQYDGCDIVEWVETPIPAFVAKQVVETNLTSGNQRRLELSYTQR